MYIGRSKAKLETCSPGDWRAGDGRGVWFGIIIDRNNYGNG